MGFSRQEYRSGLLFSSSGDLPNPGAEPQFPALQADSLLSEPSGKVLPSSSCHLITSHLSHPKGTALHSLLCLNFLIPILAARFWEINSRTCEWKSQASDRKTCTPDTKAPDFRTVTFLPAPPTHNPPLPTVGSGPGMKERKKASYIPWFDPEKAGGSKVRPEKRVIKNIKDPPPPLCFLSGTWHNQLWWLLFLLNNL